MDSDYNTNIIKELTNNSRILSKVSPMVVSASIGRLFSMAEKNH